MSYACDKDAFFYFFLYSETIFGIKRKRAFVIREFQIRDFIQFACHTIIKEKPISGLLLKGCLFRLRRFHFFRVFSRNNLNIEICGILGRVIKNTHERRARARRDIGISLHDVEIVVEGLFQFLFVQYLQLE